jgi:hypothetical protein
MGVSPSASQGVILLPGIELNWKGEHVGLLGSGRWCRGLMSTDLRDLDTSAFETTGRGTTRQPFIIWNHPRDSKLGSLPFSGDEGTAGVRAIEISNGAPHGMDWVRRKRQQIVALARQHGLALTSGTDNHGWGYAAPNWTLLRLENWRDVRYDDLSVRIEQALSKNGAHATRVVERTTADPGTSSAALALSVFIVPWRMLTVLSTHERLMWLAWTWTITGIVLAQRILTRTRLSAVTAIRPSRA